MPKLLIDGDVIAYRAGFATEKTKYLVQSGDGETGEYDDAKAAQSHMVQSGGGTLWSRKDLQPEDQALLITDVMIRDILARYAEEGLKATVFLSGVGNFRTAVATRATYKGNRDGVAKPKHYKAIMAHLRDKWGATVSAGEEADDLLGIAATDDPGSVICSIDKDLMQIPGRHYNFVTKEEVYVLPKQGVLNFYAQVLSGDATDNVPGLTGVGPVKAKKILEGAVNPTDCWARCIVHYNNEFGDLGLKYAIEAAQLVYMRKKANELWLPPGVFKREAEKAEASVAQEAAPQSVKKASRGAGLPKRARKVDSGRSEVQGSTV